MATTTIHTFSNQTNEDKKLLKRFVQFHWDLYDGDPQYIPLLNYEYLGLKLIGMTGFFEPRNVFYKHAEIRFFLAEKDGKTAGRLAAFVNHSHNKHWKDKVGFFGQFECINDRETAEMLLGEGEKWLKEKGLTAIRGPQNFPVNEATPGVLTDGFDSRPIIYYHYNKPYYAELIESCGYKPIEKIFSWEVPVNSPIEEKLVRVSKLVQKRSNVTLETWDERPFNVRKQEMFDIYNEAWSENFGFVPFTFEEFSGILEDMKMVMDKSLFVFAYINGEAAGFFGGVPNIQEKMVPKGLTKKWELLRAAKMFLTVKKVKGFRLGYLAVKKKYRKLGLDGLMLWKQKVYAQSHGYEYTDIGWVLEENEPTIQLVHMMKDVKLSKTYIVFEKQL